jgi:VWFA-related protein
MILLYDRIVRTSAFVLVGLAALVCRPVAQDAKPQVFRAMTDLVPVDVRVLDKNGKPIAGLTASDFTILEDGLPQPIRHFSVQTFMSSMPSTIERAATAPSVPNGPPGGVAPSPADAIPAQDHRVFLFVLGRGNLNRTGAGVDGALHFVQERLLPQDLVAVLAWNRATEFTTNHAGIAPVLERFKRSHERIESLIAFRESGPAALYGPPELPPLIQAEIDAVFGLPGSREVRSVQLNLGPNGTRAADDKRRVTDAQLGAIVTGKPEEADDAWDALNAFLSTNAQTMQDVSKLYTGIQYLRRFSGEKHLVFVSPAGFSFGRFEDDTDLASAASDARVVIDYFHTAGTTLSSAQARFGADRGFGRWAPTTTLPPPTPDIVNDVGSWPISNATALTEMTGGSSFVHQFRNAAMGMDRLDETTRAGYVLGYYPSNPKMDGRYRDIQVILNRRGATVQYRHGYFARPEPTPIDAKRILTYARISAAAGYVPAITDIKVDAKASFTGATSVQVKVTIDAARLTLTRRDGLTVGSIEVAMFLVDARNRTLGQVFKTVGISLTDDRLEAVKRDGAAVRLTLTSKYAPKKAKVVVYDPAADLVGSVTVDVK